MSMFCFQCQEASKNVGCTVKGVCGKDDNVAGLQDLLIYVAKAISIVSNKNRELNFIDKNANKFIVDALFTTITNANFDSNKIESLVTEGLLIRDRLVDKFISLGGDCKTLTFDGITWKPSSTEEYTTVASTVGILKEKNEDIRSLKELVIYGVKGIAAYSEHAWNLGYKDDNIDKFIQKALAETTRTDISADQLVALTLETGEYGVNVMALLDKANTTSYGNPEITTVNLGVKKNPAILISGHDLKDMEELLKQTAGTGVDIYTHSEMLPANYYPEFKKHEHFVGNYGSAWWNQNSEFESFNGPILMTTNCITPPSSSYIDRVYTTGASGFDGVKHIGNRTEGGTKDFSEIIAHAKRCNSPIELETGTLVGGFAHNQVMALADKVVDAVKSGAIRKFFVMAGCDGRMKSRDYYTEFASKLPSDTVILTAGCAKYRYNKLELGDIGGIPRVLDAGQCNDSYSLAVIALKLKEVFELNDINELPIVYNIAWYEQKAVIVLLALLYLGVKDIHLGPTLPAFLSPNVAKILVDTFNIAPIGSVDDDLKLFLGE